MSEAVFIHSPLVGPSTWNKFSRRVPDLRPAMRSGPPFQSAIEEIVAREAPNATVLIGHSAAGPLLPGIAEVMPRKVEALVYVDARLPQPGLSWLDTAPAARAELLRGLVRDGMVPPWHQWFPPSDLPAEFVAEIEPVPWAYFEERLSGATWTGRAGYLLLSEPYRDQAEAARALGMPVRQHLSHHLAMLTEPDAVKSALDALLARL